MKKVAVDGVEPDELSDGIDCRRLSDPLGATGVALNRYRVAPGDGLPGGLHAHMDQEEMFVVLDGEATFETLDGDVTVGEGEVIRFAPGEFQSSRNESDGPLVMLAIGAPRDTEDVRIPVACPECRHEDMRLDMRGDLSFVCPDCAAEYVPEACPECGRDDLRVTTGEETRTVVVCQDCDAVFDEPPLREG